VFSPTPLSIKVGTTVQWTNFDGDAHTVHGGPLNSAALATKTGYSYTFTTPGMYAYICSIHPEMTATIIVTR
jgi:plastocyanin